MQFSKNKLDMTRKTTITFPITYKGWVTIIGVGFLVEGYTRQNLHIELSWFRTSSDVRESSTYSWLALGI